VDEMQLRAFAAAQPGGAIRGAARESREIGGDEDSLHFMASLSSSKGAP
jgi:hypothetical protein